MLLRFIYSAATTEDKNRSPAQQSYVVQLLAEFQEKHGYLPQKKNMAKGPITIDNKATLKKNIGGTPIGN